VLGRLSTLLTVPIETSASSATSRMPDIGPFLIEIVSRTIKRRTAAFDQ
jgi:hypothetical protein